MTAIVLNLDVPGPRPLGARPPIMETLTRTDTPLTDPRPHTERVLGRLRGTEEGPVLVVVAALHGNEPAGLEAAEKVLSLLRERADADGRLPTMAGEVVFLAGNRKATALKRRYLRRDLNRLWTPQQVRRLRTLGASGPDEEEQLALDDEIRPLVERADPARPTHILDLHTTSGPGPAFVLLDDSEDNRRFAHALQATIVLGMEEELEGTLLYYYSDLGAVTLAFECGQHDDPGAVDRAVAAIWIALESAGLYAPGALPEAEWARLRLQADRKGMPRVVDVRYRHPITPEDRFEMAPGFSSFQPVRAGQTLGLDRHGPVVAPDRGLLLMPLYQTQGEDGFFLARPVSPAWLKLAALVQKLGLERFVHWLPGVRRLPEVPGTYVVDRRVARLAALELFHLLGFRRRGKKDRIVMVTRRLLERRGASDPDAEP